MNAELKFVKIDSLLFSDDNILYEYDDEMLKAILKDNIYLSKNTIVITKNNLPNIKIIRTKRKQKKETHR